MAKSKNKTHILVECAILLAVAAVLSVFPKFDGMWANGGSITLCSMLPVILISYRHGWKWGLLSGLVFSILQMLTGGVYFAAASLPVVILGFFLDYIFSFTVLGLGGMFRGCFKKIKNQNVAVMTELLAGTFVVTVLRYAAVVISGYFVWKDLAYATEFLSAPGFGVGQWALSNFSGDSLCLAYSFIYNGSYMIPEIIITCVGAVLISRLALYGINGKKSKNTNDTNNEEADKV